MLVLLKFIISIKFWVIHFILFVSALLCVASFIPPLPSRVGLLSQNALSLEVYGESPKKSLHN